ncbi:MAG: hypothetical protein V2J42_03685 [Wenzhouxiangella sp.]|jgi:hypothetical protein|nr:hypothetical protein [Wenzhouxiangella sp.]
MQDDDIDEVNQDLFDEAADAVVVLGNELADANPDADPWALADGLIAGAVHYWLYAHQPQDTPNEDDMMSASERIEELARQVMQSAEESEYLHSPRDRDVGNA